MPAETFDPFPGYALVRRDATLGSRQWDLFADSQAEEHEPGAQLTLTYTTSSSGGTPPAQANEVQIQIRLPGTGTVVGGTTWTISNPGTSNQTRTIHLDDNPLNQTLGAPRCGMVELYMRVIRTDLGTYDVDSRGNGAAGGDEWSRGWFRVPTRIVSHSVSNVGFAGAEPSLFAYPDPIYVRATFEEQTWSSDGQRLELRQTSGTVSSETELTTGPNFDFDQALSGDIVDDEYAVEAVDLRVVLDSDTISGNNGTFREYIWATAGHEAGWTRLSGSSLEFAGRFDVDPRVSIANETLDNVGTTVFNRGEAQGGTFEIHNARNEAITPVGSDEVQVKRVADGALEDTATVSRAAGVVSWDVTFAASGNEAPVDDVGDAKVVEWRDSSASISLTYPTSSQVGLLSSLLNVVLHLQNNDNTLDPALHTLQRLTSDLGFYSIQITNQRGQGKNGVSVTDHLRDDDDLVDQINRTDTTSTVNSNDGYLPLKAWDSALPGGGWDHWTDAGAFEGNTFERARAGAGTTDYTLLAKNPNLIVVSSGGHDTPGEDGLHWSPANDLLVGCTLFDIATNSNVDVDDSAVLDPGGVPYPRAYMIVARFNSATGQAEFFNSDGTWTSVEDNQGLVHQWQLMSIRRSNELTGVGSVGDERTYVHKFSPAETAGWGLSGLFFVPIVYHRATPYSMWGQAGVTGTANSHNGYAVDAMALGLHGVLGTR